jgi:hypothetical protein
MFIIEIGVSASVIALQEFEIGDQIIDLVGVQFQLRHFRVYRPYTLGECLFEIFDRVAVVQGAERRRLRDRAITGRTDRMTSCAIRLGEDAARSSDAFCAWAAVVTRNATPAAASIMGIRIVSFLNIAALLVTPHF